ncbi:hypothetical protein D9M69_616900 [compost metagenome]
MTIAGNVIAGHDCERLNFGLLAQFQRLHDESEDRIRLVGMNAVIDNIGMRRIKMLACRINVVAALSDRH